MNFKNLVENIHRWQRETFPAATPVSKLKHLEHEIQELIEVLQTEAESHTTGELHEYADCFFLLFGSALARGYTFNDIMIAMQNKFDINRKREWHKPNGDGVYFHKR